MAMNELRRMAYLDAMGIDSYVSRHQLPGAAPSQRLAVVRADLPAPATEAVPAPPQAAEIAMPRIDSGSRRARPRPAHRPAPPTAATPGQVPRFSLAAIVSGGWLWLEDLGGQPLATEQVQLVQAMATALARLCGAPSPAAQERPVVARFDWPIHHNRQFDQGEDAARAALAAFVGRKLEQHSCRGLVLLGEPCRDRLPLAEFDTTPVGHTPGSAALLADPALKKTAWQDLLALAGQL